MASVPKVLAFAGSLRRESYNKRLVRIAASAAEAAGAEVTLIDLKHYPMPIFDEDLEAASGPTEAVLALRAKMVDSDAFLIASPEYNSSITAVLKNTIDWVSRPGPGQPSLAGFKGKVAAIMSASPGGYGGLRGLVHLRAILGNIGVIVLPDQLAVPRAFEAFQEDGALRDPKMQAAVEELGRNLAGVTARQKA